MRTILRITGLQHQKIQNHLFPGDGNEAVAIALCGRHQNQETQILTVREIHPIPYEDCSVRTPWRVSWSTESILPLLEKATKKDWAILKIHSHPGGYAAFSSTDDAGDLRLLPMIRGWVEAAGYGGCVEVEIFSAENWWKRDAGEVLDICKERYARVC